MNILHTESSTGWGGQEMRILKEAEGMRLKGNEVIIVVAKGGGLALEARSRGFTVYELNFKKKNGVGVLFQLYQIIKKHRIDLINTHSSTDAWLGGLIGKFMKKKVVRTRHLSTPIRKGINSLLLYNWLADFTVTTCSAVISSIVLQSKISPMRCQCIPTGVNPDEMKIDPQKVRSFREELKVADQDILVGTVCFVRSWKGIKDFMRAADLLREEKNLKWVIVGGGYVNEYKGFAEELHLEGILYFTGHLPEPNHALAALDIFALLSTAHEGISQASLQAGFLEKPLITTNVGGLPEVCLDKITGFVVSPFSPDQVASAVKKLLNNPMERKRMGKEARRLVEKKFTMQHTLDGMDTIYRQVTSNR